MSATLSRRKDNPTSGWTELAIFVPTALLLGKQDDPDFRMYLEAEFAKHLGSLLE